MPNYENVLLALTNTVRDGRDIRPRLQRMRRDQIVALYNLLHSEQPSVRDTLPELIDAVITGIEMSIENEEE